MSAREFLSLDQLRAAPPVKVVDVLVPDFGWTRIRSLTTAEREAYDDANGKAEFRDYRARLVVLGLCDAEGRRIMTDDDIPVVSAWPASRTSVLWAAIAKLNAMRTIDVETALGNSESDRNGASSSGS